ncbi:MAG: M23 family metallopeptidase [Eubacteriales bacterium]
MSIKLKYWPTRILRYTSLFGPRNGDLHRGADIGAEKPRVCGDELIATSDGIIRVKDPCTTSYGNCIVTEHDDDWCDLYAHLQDFNINVGQAVRAGDIIGRMGSTGNSSGAHLHYEIRNCNYSRFYERGNVLGFKNKPVNLVDPKPYIDAAEKPPETAIYYALLIAKRCGLETDVIDYLLKYTYAKELLQSLWDVIKNRRQMPEGRGNPDADLATAISRKCGLEGITTKYIWGFADRQTVQMKIWKPLWWQMQ